MGDKKAKRCEVCTLLQKNLISVGDLEAQGLRGTIGEDVLKMSSGSLVVLKGN